MSSLLQFLGILLLLSYTKTEITEDHTGSASNNQNNTDSAPVQPRTKKQVAGTSNCDQGRSCLDCDSISNTAKYAGLDKASWDATIAGMYKNPKIWDAIGKNCKSKECVLYKNDTTDIPVCTNSTSTRIGSFYSQGTSAIYALILPILVMFVSQFLAGSIGDGSESCSCAELMNNCRDRENRQNVVIQMPISNEVGKQFKKTGIEFRYQYAKTPDKYPTQNGEDEDLAPGSITKNSTTSTI